MTIMGMFLSEIAMNATDGAPPSPQPTIVPASSSGPRNLLLYFIDQRVLSYTPVLEGGSAAYTSAESRTKACYNHCYVLAGMEMADQCFCGNSFSYPSVETPLTDSTFPCSANQAEACGGVD
ncbi:hypothetical protein EDB89DRAFT_2007063 [Lactarius sanguifluus]|nr:hypothetical protein EDB89DRAFT_2007063 [Lactarius sanguifluus]